MSGTRPELLAGLSKPVDSLARGGSHVSAGIPNRECGDAGGCAFDSQRLERVNRVEANLGGGIRKHPQEACRHAASFEAAQRFTRCTPKASRLILIAQNAQQGLECLRIAM